MRYDSTERSLDLAYFSTFPLPLACGGAFDSRARTLLDLCTIYKESVRAEKDSEPLFGNNIDRKARARPSRQVLRLSI